MTGSGKSLTPFSRMHCANLSAVDCCLGLRWPLKLPGGCRLLHAARAFSQTAALTLIPKLKSPDALGSGNAG